MIVGTLGALIFSILWFGSMLVAERRGRRFGRALALERARREAFNVAADTRGDLDIDRETAHTIALGAQRVADRLTVIIATGAP